MLNFFLVYYVFPDLFFIGRMYAIQKGIKLDSKSPEAKKFLFGLMDTLETVSRPFELLFLTTCLFRI